MKASATAVIDGGGGGRGGSNESQMAGCLVCAHVATKDAVLYEGPKSRPKGYVGEDYCRVAGGHVVTFFFTHRAAGVHKDVHFSCLHINRLL